MRIGYRAWIQLGRCDREGLTDDDVAGLDMSEFYQGRINTMDKLFKGCEGLENPDLSNLNTSRVTSMASMFEGCTNLRRLDLSTFDFGQVICVKEMFRGCERLEEVFLSDTILGRRAIPRDVRAYTQEELNDIYRSEYVSCGPQLADMKVARLKNEQKSVSIPFGEATQEELYSWLGLRFGQQKITIVPHRALNNSL